MLPQSYDHVSEETKQTVQLFISRATGYLQGKGNSDEEADATMNKIKEKANSDALEWAVAVWKRSRLPCPAERYVQHFAHLVWYAATDQEAVGVTEEEARGIFQIKEQTPENDAQKNRSTSSSQVPEHMDWSGAPLTVDQLKHMDAGLMGTIWEARIYRGDNSYHEAGPFAVAIPKDKAWLVLGEDFNLVRTAILSRWWPIRLYTCDMGHYLQVGLWIPKLQFQERSVRQKMVRYKIEELYYILRHWSFQVQGRGMQSLIACLAGYLVDVGVL